MSKKSEFQKKQEEGNVLCHLCGEILGTEACCGESAPKMIYGHLLKAEVPIGPGRVAAVKAAKEVQRKEGLHGPAFNQACIQAALEAAAATVQVRPTSVLSKVQEKAKSSSERIRLGRELRESGFSALEVAQALKELDN